MQCKVVRVVSWAPESQGPFVEINADDFKPDIHKLYVEPDAQKEPLEQPAPQVVPHEKRSHRSR